MEREKIVGPHNLQWWQENHACTPTILYHKYIYKCIRHIWMWKKNRLMFNLLNWLQSQKYTTRRHQSFFFHFYQKWQCDTRNLSYPTLTSNIHTLLWITSISNWNNNPDILNNFKMFLKNITQKRSIHSFSFGLMRIM